MEWNQYFFLDGIGNQSELIMYGFLHSANPNQRLDLRRIQFRINVIDTQTSNSS